MKETIHSKILNNEQILQAFSTSDWGPLRPKLVWKEEHYDNTTIECNKAFFQQFDINYTDTVALNQSHSDRVLVVNESDKGAGVVNRTAGLDGDALVTNISQVPLLIMVADCVPVFFHDPIKKVIGVAHSGWMGTFAEIAKKTIVTMKNSFQTDSRDIQVYIGPCIAGRNYNVSAERENRKEANEYFKKMGGAEIKDNEYYIDLRSVIRKQLIELGVKDSNIETSNLCTFEQENLYSHRGKNMPSNNIGVIMLK